MEEETKVPDAPVEGKTEGQAAPSQQPQQVVDWVAVREEAERQTARGIKSLQHLLKVSKGAGKPSLHELVVLFTALGMYVNTLPKEMMEVGKILSSMILQASLRLDTLITLLIEKGLFTKEEFQERGATIVKEQRDAIESARAEQLKKAVDQAQQAAKNG